MPNTKSAAKAMRQSARKREFNLKVKDAVKRSVKEVRKLIKEGKKTEAAEAMKRAMAALDKAAKKGVVHKNHASRKKSRLAKSLAK
ncbi:MAG: ribosomal protein [Candidatus Doudnabacteria bacterium]|nr:ribosomal protein [Candidatus Doudnabacteria bacterium]